MHLVDDTSLSPINRHFSISEYIGAAWSRRAFILEEAKATAFSQGRDTSLGKLWLVLDPILQVALYTVVFGLVLNASHGIENYIGFIVIGVIFFGFVSKGLNSGSLLLQRFRGLISTFDFPKIVIPAATAIRVALDNFPACAIAAIMAIATSNFSHFPFASLLSIPLFLLMSTLVFGATLIISWITFKVSDFHQVVGLGTRALFFLSGVFFDVDQSSNEALRHLIQLNPISTFLTGLRSMFLYDQIPPLSDWVYLAIWSAVLNTVGFIVYWRYEGSFSNVG